ncbi:MAG: tRNA (adenosine(37)-N6)-threonylcarbamoyltransferase complex dimerization subunit type 1 TsaB [Muribaculaceae bacterium]|nr:tRNA (adenosine(37)-N6)-threonylcarbamoyltransferase complex dimerization subunit type 1 TsaB [Muribaculaceae bacterium]
MAVLICIDTSTTACSVCLSADGMVLTQRSETQARNHASLLADFVKHCLDHAAAHELRVDAVAVSMGPGSYTGLRIGLSMAKGLAYSLNIPMIGVDTLKLLATTVMFGNNPEPEADSILIPMIDARRMEVFTAAFDMALTVLREPGPMILAADSYSELMDSGRPVYMMGDGMDKAQPLFMLRNNVVFVPGIIPLASEMVALAELAWHRKEFLDTAYCTPNYLKAFQTTKPKKQI